MPVRDTFHEAVRNALIKDGWDITDDPLFIDYEGIRLFVDLGAEKVIAAKKEDQKIAVEIKSFKGISFFPEFYMAVGQYTSYHTALEEYEPHRLLYLAVPLEIYETYFHLALIKNVINKTNIKILVFQVTQEEITKWIE